MANGYPISYRRVGNGPVAVLIHGMITDHGLWDFHVATLAKRFHSITPTLRYFGASAWSDEGERFSTDHQAEDIGAFIDALNLGPVHLVGWSLGGAIALCLAARRPELIKSMVLYEPSLVAAISDPGYLEAVTQDRTAMFAAAKACFDRDDGMSAIEAFVDGANDKQGTFRDFPAALQKVFQRNVRVLGPFFGGPVPPRMTPEDFESIKTKTILALGEQSRSFWQIAIPQIAERMPNAELLRVSNAKHLWPAESPGAFSKFVIDAIG